MSVLTQFVDSILALPDRFAVAAGTDPLAAVLLLIGAVLTVGVVAYFGYLSVRGVIAAVLPAPGGGVTHRP